MWRGQLNMAFPRSSDHCSSPWIWLQRNGVPSSDVLSDAQGGRGNLVMMDVD